MILNINELKNIRKNNPNKRIVLALGSFDLFHWEHLNYLNDAKKLGDILVVCVKDDYSVSFKAKDRPVIEEKQRIEIVDNLKCVDFCTLVSPQKLNDNIYSIIPMIDDVHVKLWWELFYSVFEYLEPDILYYEENERLQPSREKISDIFNIKLISRFRTERISTTKIIDKINKTKI